MCSKRLAAILLIKKMLPKLRKRIEIRSPQIQTARVEQSQAHLIMNETLDIDFNLRTHMHGLNTFSATSN